MKTHFTGNYEHHGGDVLKAIRRAGLFALRRLGFLIRQTAQAEIKFERGPSDPGSPPHSHRKLYRAKGKRRSTKEKFSTRDLTKSGMLPGSILYDIERHPDAVVVGPSFAIVGESASPHEHGGEYKGQDYPERPFMGPALAEDIGELPGLLAEQMNEI